MTPTPENIAAERRAAQELARARPAAETAIERAVAEAIRDLGLTTRVPVIGHQVVWPPVAVALDAAPSTLAVSPRERIQLRHTRLLKAGLASDQVATVESGWEAQGWSAIVEPLSGFAAYPAVVRGDRRLAVLVEVSAHEWAHHYLAFFPLGARYGRAAELTSINETVADLMGREIALRVAANGALAVESPAPAPAQPRPRPSIDVGRLLRQTRVDAERLLAAGDVEGAERLFAERRAALVEAGYPLRKLNQAYFAFHGLYAEGPIAAPRNPIGAAVAKLRQRSPSLAAFVASARRVRSLEDLMRLAEESPGETPRDEQSK
jgi:hypothetical protein